jgi:hypothetical protein
VTVTVFKSGRVECIASATLPMTARRAWGQIRDFHRFACHDHFHRAISIDGSVPRAGAAISIEHQFGPFHVRRVGRIVRWREGDGFAFSDLSMRGIKRGFPHIMSIRVMDDVAKESCQLTLRVSGRWTLPSPRWITKAWLGWVTASIFQRTRNDLLALHEATCITN